MKFLGQSLSQGYHQHASKPRKGFISFITLPLIFISRKKTSVDLMAMLRIFSMHFSTFYQKESVL